jgi:hypothetical protein
MKRACHRDVLRVVELDEKGFKPSTISSTVGLDEAMVALILEKRDEVEGGRAVANDSMHRS